MAFNRPLQTRNNNTESANDNWKADAFLNIRFRRPDGSYFKLGSTSSLSLKETRKMDRTLIEKVRKGDKEAVLEQLLSIMELDLVFPEEDKEVGDLGF